MRKSGILMPVFSLPGPYGIGCFGKQAYKFVDFLEAAGQKLWQILPLGPTSYGDSPYQSFSTFAGNPYFIDLEELVRKGWIREKELAACSFGDTDRYIDYGLLYKNRMAVLKRAFLNSHMEKDEGFQAFYQENESWLPDYALFMAVKELHQGKSFSCWEEPIRLREPEALKDYREKCRTEILFYEFLQYLFEQQWKKLKNYANGKGIQIIGDLPIYVALDSADTWADPELFQLDENLIPRAVAGCPPDAFSATGQLWGNPLYDWEHHKKTGYDWWIRRFAQSFKLYDIVRIDHFRGFDEYYSIPYGDATAEHGQWMPGPGYELFQSMKEALGKKQIIAEDLGYLTPSVLKLVQKTGYPGMKVLQFAFGGGAENPYLPHNYQRNCIVYTGTHDNDTTSGWYRTLKRREKAEVRKYFHVHRGADINWTMILAAQASVADTVVIPMQDYLGTGSDTRINLPSTLGDNWKWRMYEEEITAELAGRILDITRTYGR